MRSLTLVKLPRQMAWRVMIPKKIGYEKGTAEPTLPVLRRILDSVGRAPTLGVEPTTSALDEALGLADELGGPVLDTAVQLLLRVCATAHEAGARIVVGGEVAAALQGVPTRSTDLCARGAATARGGPRRADSHRRARSRRGSAGGASSGRALRLDGVGTG